MAKWCFAAVKESIILSAIWSITIQRAQTGVTVPEISSTDNSGNVMANVRFIPVETGLDDGTNVEIKSGLEEGQEVLTGTNSTTTTTKSSSSSGFNLVGGGGPPGDGGPPPN